MAKVNWKGGALLAPLPAVMVSCGTMEQANIITVAWTGIISTIPPRAYISVRPTRHSYSIIKESGEFVINLTPRRLCETCDYCGIVTGRCVDKVKKCGFTLEKSENIAAPRLAQSPMSLECRVFDVIPLGSHDMFLCDILSAAVDDSLIDKNGKLHLDRADLVAFAHGEYYSLSDVIGQFGFSVADKKKGRGAVIPSAEETADSAGGRMHGINPQNKPGKANISGKNSQSDRPGKTAGSRENGKGYAKSKGNSNFSGRGNKKYSSARKK